MGKWDMNGLGPEPVADAAPVNALLVTPPTGAREASMQELIADNPDTPTHKDSWETPENGVLWARRERFQYNAWLSPPQRQSLMLAAKLIHAKSAQDCLMLVLERALKDILTEYSKPEVGGVHAADSAKVLRYLTSWGDLTTGRRGPGGT